VSATVDGLISGMDTTSVIASLMQAEAAPRTMLRQKVSTEQTALSAYQGLNTKLAALQTAATAMSSLSTWRLVAPTSTSTGVTATATSSNTNQTGTVSFDVLSTAKAQISTVVVPSSGDITTGTGQVTLTVGTGSPVNVDVSADPSAAGVASAINKAGLGLKAAVVTTSDGSTVLQVTGAQTGAANGFTVDGIAGTVMTPTAASDAVLQVGGDPAVGGYQVSSSSNSFTNLVTGTTITVTKPETGVTVTVNSDAKAIAGKMQALVDAANSVLSEVRSKTSISTDTSSGTAKTTGAALSGDYMVRQIADKVLSTVSQGVTGYGSLSQFGIELTSDGKFSFKQDKFTAAYANDPDALKTYASAFADNVAKVATGQQTNVTNAITSHTNLIKALNNQISDWDNRLSIRQQTLQRQFSNMETSLGKMKNQSTWLAGQIASLG
jgi:flagellar hook-associated protein 2